MRALLALLGVVAVVATATAPAAAVVGPASTGAGAGTSPSASALASGPGDPGAPLADRADPPSDRLGWENGKWYDDPVVVDSSDGFNDTEIERVVARGMARVERIRGLEFQADVPVEIITREEFQAENDAQYENVTAANRRHQNVKYEALFMVGEDEDALAARERTFGSSVLGYYSPGEDRIVLVSEDTETPDLDEITLSQELFHALQDQQFNLSSYNTSTEERRNAVNGIIEGDGNYVDYLYERRCNAEWDCERPFSLNVGGGDVHLGLYLLVFQPYSDGPAFVAGIRRESGWAGVNDVYADPPASSEQVIHPEKYGVDQPTTVRVNATPGGDWRVLDLNESANYAEFGEAGLFSMFMYPAFASGGTEPVISSRPFVNRSGGTISQFDPYNYSHPYTAGWDGDKLVPYVNSEFGDENETAYVWKTAWDSPEDARQFATGYRELLGAHGARNVNDSVYRIPDDRPFGDAFRVDVTGSTVTIVNAPHTANLSAILPPPDQRAAAGANGTTDATTDSDGQPGLGPLAAVLAVALCLAGLARRRA